MSDSLADLSSFLPSEFPFGDFPPRPPYDFAPSSSTDSESDDDDFPGLTRRFTRSVSFQERPHPVQTKVFSVSGPKHIRSSPATPFVPANERAWDIGIIYAAAEKVARMKMKTANDAVYTTRGLLGVPNHPGPLFSHHNLQNEEFLKNEEFLRRQFHEGVFAAANCNGRFVSGKTVGFGPAAWPSFSVESQRRQQTAGGFAVKPLPVGTAGVSKKACAGTGVFLPRNYPSVPPEPCKKPVCWDANVAAIRVVQSPNRNLDHIIGQPQTNIRGVYSRQHQVQVQVPVPPVPNHHHDHLNHKYNELSVEEMIMAQRQNAVMFSQQRFTKHEPEVVLPQEWTY